MALRRLKKELTEFQENLAGGYSNIIKGGPINDDLFRWNVTIIGTDDTPYQRGHYDLAIVFPRDYPFKPPNIRFLTKIYHCNVNDKGGIDCDILKDNWSPALTIAKTLIALQSCMATGGNPLDPLVSDIANLMLSNIKEFLKIASEWNVKFANGDPAPNTINETSFRCFLPWTDRHRYQIMYEEQKKQIEKSKKDMIQYHKTRFMQNNVKNDMKLYVKTLTGHKYDIGCRATDFVFTIKKLLEKQSGVPVKAQRLIYAGKLLQDYTRLTGYISDEATMHLVLRLRGNLNEKKENTEIVEKDVCSQLVKMGFEYNIAVNAANVYPNDLNAAINSVVAQNAQNDEEKKEIELSPKEHIEKHFFTFLQEIHLEQYVDKFKENECCDMESIPYFDDDILKNDIGIKSKIARKKFIGKCKEVEKEMKRFKNEYGISAILHKKLAKYGLVTLDIVCMSVENKLDLKKI